MVRTEEEFPIDERRFESLWPLTEGRRLTKTRHLIPLDVGPRPPSSTSTAAPTTAC